MHQILVNKEKSFLVLKDTHSMFYGMNKTNEWMIINFFFIRENCIWSCDSDVNAIAQPWRRDICVCPLLFPPQLPTLHSVPLPPSYRPCGWWICSLCRRVLLRSFSSQPGSSTATQGTDWCPFTLVLTVVNWTCWETRHLNFSRAL